MIKFIIFLTISLSLSFSLLSDDKLTIASYGRIGTASNLEGQSGSPTQIVSNSTRVEKLSYQELSIKYDFTSEESLKDGINVKLNFTLAFDQDLFHYTGKFQMNTAVRNFYIDVDNILLKNFNIWIGSRMYRGDDIYLLDFWPLDDLNTVGAGLKYSINSTEIKFHLGANRLDQGDTKDPYQLLYYTIPLRDKIGSENIILLDRQKYIASLGLSQELKSLNLKIKLYSEFHSISEASYKYEFQDYNLPSDKGYLIGLQTTYYGFNNNPNNYLHFFIKYAMNMAAYNTLGIPYGLNKDNKTTGANEFLTGLALNFEAGDIGLLLGTYFKAFRDADNNNFDDDDVNEAIIDIRFIYYIGKYFHLSTELSYQTLEVKNINSVSMKKETPQMFKFLFMPTISPNGRGNLKQPKLRLVYSLSMYNDAAQKIINHENPSTSLTPSSSWGNYNHYLGISAEWWFNN